MAARPTIDTVEDLSGVASGANEANPYQALIDAGSNSPAKIQEHYSAHREARHAQQRAKFLDPGFEQLLIDPVLRRIEHPMAGDDPDPDKRHGLVFWARPPEHVLQLAAHLQQRLVATAAPHLWLMPLHRMHMTTLEITHSRTPEEADALVQAMLGGGGGGGTAVGSGRGENAIAAITNYTYHHRARLVKPMLSYDLSGVALSFVPAAGEPSSSPPPVPPGCPCPAAAPSASTSASSCPFTYHHLRRDLFVRAAATPGVHVAARYVVPSAHITLARFLSQDDHALAAARQAWVLAVDDLNQWLRQHVWDATWEQPQQQALPEVEAKTPASLQPLLPPSRRFVGEWIVGQERGLDARTGAVWYGGGRSVMVGEGF